jgi:hypothetical protein
MVRHYLIAIQQQLEAHLEGPQPFSIGNSPKSIQMHFCVFDFSEKISVFIGAKRD